MKSSGSTTRPLRARSALAAASAFALLLSACAGDDEAAAPEASASEEAPVAGSETEGEMGEEMEGPSFDLSGQEIAIAFGDNSAQSLGNRLMLEDLRGWGAEVDDIQLTTATGLSAIIADQVDFAAGMGADEAILGLSTGTDLTAIGAPDSANTYVVVARDEFSSIEDLEGGRIATSGPGGFNTALMSVSLQRAGIAEEDVELLTIGGSPERSAALLTGQVDATAIFFADWLAIEAQSDDIVLLERMDELIPNIPSFYYYADSSYWEENPDVALAVACANLRANVRIASDKDFFVEFALEEIPGSDEAVLSAVYDELTTNLINWPTTPSDMMNVDGLPSLVELMIETGDLEEEVDVSGLVDLSYLDEAVAMGCGA